MSWENEKMSWFKISEGETKEFTIEAIEEKKPTDKIKGLSGRDYYYEFKTDMGAWTVNNMGAFLALQGAKVQAGDRIKVTYVKKGSLGKPSQFKVEVLEKGEEIKF